MIFALKDRHLRSLLTAFFFGLSGLLLISLFTTGSFDFPSDQGWVYAYQTLIIGTAGFATLIFGFYVHGQTLTAKRRLYRVRLYDALSDLSDYYSSCYSYYMSAVKPASYPEKPAESMNILKSSVEYLKDKDSSYMAYVVSKYQIFNSRMKSYNKVIGSTAHAERIGDLIFLWWLTDRIWSFARFETDSIAVENLTDDVLLNKLTFGSLGLVPSTSINMDHLKYYLDVLSRSHNHLKDGFDG